MFSIYLLKVDGEKDIWARGGGEGGEVRPEEGHGTQWRRLFQFSITNATNVYCSMR